MLQETTTAASGGNAAALKQMGVDHLAREMLGNPGSYIVQLTVAAVLTSLYPAFTVLLAATALREHVHRAQAVGLLLSGVAVALVAAG